MVPNAAAVHAETCSFGHGWPRDANGQLVNAIWFHIFIISFAHIKKFFRFFSLAVAAVAAQCPSRVYVSVSFWLGCVGTQFNIFTLTMKAHRRPLKFHQNNSFAHKKQPNAFSRRYLLPFVCLFVRIDGELHMCAMCDMRAWYQSFDVHRIDCILERAIIIIKSCQDSWRVERKKKTKTTYSCAARRHMKNWRREHKEFDLVFV